MSGIENANTLLPVGEYGLTYRRENSPLWHRYKRNNLTASWFDWFIMLTGTGERKYVYEHSANEARQIRGCIAHGNVNIDTGFCGSSLIHMAEFYTELKGKVNKSKYIILDVRDTMKYYVKH